MHENPTHERTRGDRNLGDMERDVVHLLTDPQNYPTLWSIPDIGREIEYFDAEALIRPLCGAGLLYKTSDGFVFAAPAAFHLVSLVGQSI